MNYLEKIRKIIAEEKHKNQKISSNDLYIAQLVKLEFHNVERLPYGLLRYQRKVKMFNPALYTIVRKDYYRNTAVDVYDNSLYEIKGPQLNASTVVQLEKPIKYPKKRIRYKDLDEILEEYKSTIKTKK